MSTKHLTRINFLLLLGAAVAPFVNAAPSVEPGPASQRTVCPLWLEPEAITSNKPPQGWAVFMPQSGRLTGGGLLHGAPNGSGYLKPDTAKLSKVGVHETGITTWKFTPPPFIRNMAVLLIWTARNLQANPSECDYLRGHVQA